MLNRLLRFLKLPFSAASVISNVIFSVVPEDFFLSQLWISQLSTALHLLCVHLICFAITFLLCIIIYAIYLKIRRSVTLRKNNYIIKISYGDIFKQRNCKRVITFDECFSSRVGPNPSDINADSVCGKYLLQYPIDDIDALLCASHVTPSSEPSAFQLKTRYPSGILIPRNNDLLMAFAKLNPDGVGEMSRSDYLDCLSLLWGELDKYYGQQDVCIPILGSGVTRGFCASHTQQELLDIMLASYRLSDHKIKAPYKLRIICREKQNFSLNRIDTTL